MFALARSLVYGSLFVALLLVFLPARLLAWSGFARPEIGMLQVVGLTIAALGGLLAAWCVVTFALVGRGTPAPFDPPRRLVVDGPYRFVRNPMYLGATSAPAGAALFYESLALLAYAALFLAAAHLFVTGYEEPALARTFGTPYDDYRRATPRWLPRPPRRSRAAGAPPARHRRGSAGRLALVAAAGLAFLCSSTGAAAAQDTIPRTTIAAAPSTGFLDRAVTVDGHSYPYQVYVPRGYSPDTAWPVILFLHGAGERGDDGLFQTAVGLGSVIRSDPERFPALVVFPQSPEDSTWTGAPARAAMAALDRTMEEFATDPSRVYLTGLSMGGNGSWYLAYRHPDRFAAVVPICGWVAPNPFAPDPVVPTDDGEPFDALARRLAGVAVWIVHGEVDPVVPVEDSRRAAVALGAAPAGTDAPALPDPASGRGDVRYTELLGTGHNAWDPAYGSDALVTWLFAQRREP